MCRIGMENVPAKIDKCYQKEEKEFLIVCSSTTEHVFESLWNDYSEIAIDILGYIETESGRISEEESYITWCDNDNKEKYFTKDGVYRIKGRLPENSYDTGNLYLTEIIADNEKNDFLENLLTEYKKEFSINSEIFGNMILDKRNYCFNTEIQWNNKMIKFEIRIYSIEDIENTLLLAEDFYRNLDYWYNKAREEARENIEGIQCETEIEINDNILKEISENLIMDSVCICTNGLFTITYNDGSNIAGCQFLSYGNVNEDTDEYIDENI